MHGVVIVIHGAKLNIKLYIYSSKFREKGRDMDTDRGTN